MSKSNVYDKLRKNPQYTRMKRHTVSLLRHSTAKKLTNLVVVEFERLLRRRRLCGKPYILIIDATSVCNLRCALCPTGQGQVKRSPSRMDFDDFRRVTDCLADYLYEVSLHNWGEPFLHPKLFDMVEYASSRNIGTSISSNLNVLADEQLERIFSSGLEYLVVSLDGTTQESYGKYRVKGNLKLVKEHLSAIVARKKQLKSCLPVIEWQFIVMRHNVYEAEAASEMAEDIGVDLLRFVPVGLPFGANDRHSLADEWFPEYRREQGNGSSSSFLGRRGRLPCFYLYRSTTVNSDGHVAPCCVVYDPAHDFTCFCDDDFESIWNGAKYQAARSLFGSKPDRNQKNIACRQCNLFTVRT